MMEQPQEIQVKLHAVDGNELCRYIAHKISNDHEIDIHEDDVYFCIAEHKFSHDKADIDSCLFELIIEEEDYCNGDNPNDIKELILKTIADEFGGHFNINFLSVCAYL